MRRFEILLPCFGKAPGGHVDVGKVAGMDLQPGGSNDKELLPGRQLPVWSLRDNVEEEASDDRIVRDAIA